MMLFGLSTESPVHHDHLSMLLRIDDIQGQMLQINDNDSRQTSINKLLVEDPGQKTTRKTESSVQVVKPVFHCKCWDKYMCLLKKVRVGAGP